MITGDVVLVCDNNLLMLANDVQDLLRILYPISAIPVISFEDTSNLPKVTSYYKTI